jgi:hypothetical protein
MIKPAARLLIRDDFAGSGRNSMPLGEIVSRIGSGVNFPFDSSSGGLFSVIMDDLHLLRILAGTQHELGVPEQAINDIGLVFHPIIHDFTFAVRPPGPEGPEPRGLRYSSTSGYTSSPRRRTRAADECFRRRP